MPKGKLASQAIHATRLSTLKYLRDMPPEKMLEAMDYFLGKNSCGSAFTVTAKNMGQIERIKKEAIEAGLPWAMFSDSGHILPPHFDGNPIVTGISIGPAPRARIRHISKRYQSIK